MYVLCDNVCSSSELEYTVEQLQLQLHLCNSLSEIFDANTLICATNLERGSCTYAESTTTHTIRADLRSRQLGKNV